MLATLMTIFFVLWILIGVGAIFLLVKAHKMLQNIERKIAVAEGVMAETYNVISPLLKNKELFAIIGALAGIAKYFRRKKKG